MNLLKRKVLKKAPLKTTNKAAKKVNSPEKYKKKILEKNCPYYYYFFCSHPPWLWIGSGSAEHPSYSVRKQKPGKSGKSWQAGQSGKSGQQLGCHQNHPPWLGICFRRSLQGVLRTPFVWQESSRPMQMLTQHAI